MTITQGAAIPPQAITDAAWAAACDAARPYAADTAAEIVTSLRMARAGRAAEVMITKIIGAALAKATAAALEAAAPRLPGAAVTPSILQRDLINAQERLHLARQALLDDGYFTPDQVGPDIAPRIAERLSAARRELAEAVAAERERCAQLAEREHVMYTHSHGPGCPGVRRPFAQRLREQP